MNSLKQNIDRIPEIKKAIHTEEYYEHYEIIKNIPTNNTISIVMTSSNRSKQTYYTLNSFLNSTYKDIHVVLVDDSNRDPIDPDILKGYSFSIDFIRIKRDKKIWVNPCVNYNIGFLFIKGGKVIIQNAEVFHVGDVLSYIANNINDRSYYVFDVKSSNSYASNDILYSSKSHGIEIYNTHNIFNTGASEWYQSSKTNNRKFHFLSAMTLEVFKLIGSFSYDYSFGTAYDDDDLVLKINASQIPIVSIDRIKSNCGGIHLYHVLAGNDWEKGVESNHTIFETKKHYYNINRTYIELSE
jgi:glycosyltransferase involved in cell wall biosynthesis